MSGPRDARVWRKSSFSEANGNSSCVEVSLGSESAGLRDSKNAAGGTLEFGVAAWRRLVNLSV